MKDVYTLMSTLTTDEQKDLLRNIVGDITPPPDFDSWKSAALSERMRRVDLEKKVAELEEELRPLREAKAEADLEALRLSRVERIVDILFNTVVSGSIHTNNSKCLHPEKYWWWNHAHLVHSEPNWNGSVHITVNSYVGGGEDEDYEMTLPREWLDVEDPTEIITQWANGVTAEKEAKARADKLRQAQYELERAQAKIKQLEQTVKENQ